MLPDLVAAFPGSRLKAEPGAVTGVIAHEGVFHPVRVRLQPFTELFIALAPTQDFALRIAWGDRWLGDTDIGDERIDDAFFIRTNDRALARRWLDAPARAALTGVVDGMAAKPRSTVGADLAHRAPRMLVTEASERGVSQGSDPCDTTKPSPPWALEVVPEGPYR